MIPWEHASWKRRNNDVWLHQGSQILELGLRTQAPQRTTAW